MKTYLLLMGILCSSICLSAQHEAFINAEENGKEDVYENPEHKYKIAFAFGYSHIPAGFRAEKEEESVFIPSIGIDFFYALNHKFSLGMIADLELGEYIVDFNRENLNRERAFILALIGAYEVFPHCQFLLGGGVEFERHKNLGVFRIGAEYEVEVGEGWDLGPSLFFDFKEEFNVWTLGVVIGKKF